MDIIPDNVIDIAEICDELIDWVEERKERTDPGRMGSILIFLGSKIIYRHSMDEKISDQLINELVKLGQVMAKPE